jgi:hypothetical protein
MKPSWTQLRDKETILPKGTKVMATLIRYGHPVVETTLAEDTPFNYQGIMRVAHDDRTVLALYPPAQII